MAKARSCGRAWAVCGAALLLLRAAGAQEGNAAALLQAVAEVYRQDRAMRIEFPSRLEVDGHPAPDRIRMRLESRPPQQLCLTSEPTPEGDRTTMCTDGVSVWQTYDRGTKPDRRWEPAELAGEANPLSFLRNQWRRYHGRFAALDQAELMSAEVKRRRLTLDGRRRECAVVRIRAPEARHPGTSWEELWIDLETRRVLRSDLHQRRPGSTVFGVRIVEYTAIETLP
ncbi:MAG: hypothetical protein RMK57_03305 [Bryobacterales bacterium]|nr:hypothetical protein [Bryobacteraceae bacterium]MDW8353535.1 hypothetical protein [Bryobacterales bacterium]